MWQIKIHDPSGETRILPLDSQATLGRDAHCEIQLRDPTLPAEVGQIWVKHKDSVKSSPYWFRVHESAPPVILGDIPCREALLPPNIECKLGETAFSLENSENHVPLPQMPAGVRSWLTCSEEGKKTLWLTKKAAATPLAIYLAGETGTGKEVLAQLLHVWSDRASGPFVPLHCGALPLSLAESELFGHVKGAFTGASHQRPGALMQAHNGTLFLDEVGDLPLDIQVKILRFLENGEIRPVGADLPSKADVRLICATHHPLEKLVNEGKFRRDLYYRLASVTIEIPPLRDRPEDIELLSKRFAHELDRTLSQQSIRRLQAHDWPGNVRELRHAIERASGLAGPFSPILGEEAFEFLLTPNNISESPELELKSPVLTLAEMERLVLLKALKISHGNRAQAAKIMGIARSTIFEMIKRYKIQGPRQREWAWH